MKVELIEVPTEITHDSVLAYLASCSSVVRDAQPKNNERLFKRLQKESFGDKPSRVFEYVPCKISSGMIQYSTMQLFGFFYTEEQTDNTSVFERAYYTNARELLNWGWTWEEVLKVVDFTNYKAVKVTAPYFLYGQMSTHNQITSVSHSNRYTQSKLGYWCPIPNHPNWDYTVRETTPNSLERIMKAAGIVRREVFARGSDMLEYRVSTLGGYTNNPNAWEHFINQRLNDSHTQLEMRELASLIKEKLEGVSNN